VLAPAAGRPLPGWRGGLKSVPAAAARKNGERARACRGAGLRPKAGLAFALGLLALCLWGPEPAAGGVLLSRSEALELAFPDCEVEREARYLTREEQNRAAELAGVDVDSRLVVRYLAVCRTCEASVEQGRPTAGGGGRMMPATEPGRALAALASCGGAAYFDVHRVRTLPETLMIVVDPDGGVRQLEVMSFLEPEEYIPRRTWYDQFLRRRLGPRLRLKRSIHAVTGATLTARATASAVRRVLAIDQVLKEGQGRAGTPSRSTP